MAHSNPKQFIVIDGQPDVCQLHDQTIHLKKMMISLGPYGGESLDLSTSFAN